MSLPASTKRRMLPYHRWHSPWTVSTSVVVRSRARKVREWLAPTTPETMHFCPRGPGQVARAYAGVELDTELWNRVTHSRKLHQHIVYQKCDASGPPSNVHHGGATVLTRTSTPH